MATGYEIISTTVTVDPSDPDVYPPPYPGWAGWKLVAVAAPAGKRWIGAAGTVRNIYGSPGVYGEQVALSVDGSEYTAQVMLDNDPDGQPVETTRTIRVVAVDE